MLSNDWSNMSNNNNEIINYVAYHVYYTCVPSCFSHVKLCDPMDWSLSGSSVQRFSKQSHAFLQGSSQPRDQNHISLCLLHWHVCPLPLAPPRKSMYIIIYHTIIFHYNIITTNFLANSIYVYGWHYYYYFQTTEKPTSYIDFDKNAKKSWDDESNSIFRHICSQPLVIIHVSSISYYA